MKDLGLLLAIGAGAYILTQRNKDKDSNKTKGKTPIVVDLDTPDPDAGDAGDLRAVTLAELTSGQISAAEAPQVYISNYQIEIIKDIFELELDINNVVRDILTNKQSYIEGTPESLITDIRNYTNELEGCINSGYNTLTTITPGKALSTQIINVFNEVGQCAIKVREQVMYLAGEDGELMSYIKPESFESLQNETGQILNDFQVEYGGLPEPLGEPSYEN
jgi:hypothetical protein|tara:strand:+ start:330 stop:989 length:660 start_codon:yes stop_codon:yes gene_type:complete